MPVAPVSIIAVWFGVRRGFGVLGGWGEGLGPGVGTGGLQRCAVDVEVELLPNLVLVLFATTTALSVPPPSQARTPRCRTLTCIFGQLEALIRHVIHLTLAIGAQFLWPAAFRSPVTASTSFATTATSQKLLQSAHFLTEQAHIRL